MAVVWRSVADVSRKANGRVDWRRLLGIRTWTRTWTWGWHYIWTGFLAAWHTWQVNFLCCSIYLQEAKLMVKAVQTCITHCAATSLRYVMPCHPHITIGQLQKTCREWARLKFKINYKTICSTLIYLYIIHKMCLKCNGRVSK